MKKLISILTLGSLFFSLTGCSTTQTVNDEKTNIVCTLFPEYDWTRELLGSHVNDVNLTYLLSNGMDLHNYQPSAKDMITISECDLFIYVGGESESWVDDALREVTNPDMQVIRLMDVVQDAIKEEEIKEGMQTEEVHSHEHEEDTPEYDEHVWLSLKNAKTICNSISNALCKLDAENTTDYETNLTSYQAKLDALDNDFARMTEQASFKTVIFGDRFPFRYLVDDYGIDYYAVFTGCSSETEASFETIVFLAQKIDELHADTIFKIENSDDALAKSIISSTSDKNQKIANLNSMQSVNMDDIADGASYLSIMQENFITLQEVLK